MAVGSFLSGLAGGYRTGQDIQDRRKERGILEEIAKQGRSDKQQGNKGGGNAKASVPQDGGTRSRGRSVLPAAKQGGGGRGDYASEFDASLARTESGGRYGVVNSEGYTGKYQFGQARLDDYNRANDAQITTATFRDDPQLQERVQDWNVRDIDTFIDENGLGDYIGRDVGGVTMTRDGLRAMAHLGGKSGMRNFVTSGGRYNPADSNGTALSDYAKTHASAVPRTQPEAPPTERGVTTRAASIVSQFYR